MATLNRIQYTRSVARTVPFTEARGKLTELIDELGLVHDHIVITRNGRPAAVMLSPREYEMLQETIEVLGDEETLEALEESERDVAAGRLYSLDEVKRELGLA
jgi:prevent-host-death family protein